jgi:hypothetical protein
MRMRRFMLCVAFFASPVAAPATPYHVSPNGADSNPGAASAPFATLHRALQQVRWDRTAAPGASATILLASGEHFLDRPLVLYGADSDLAIEAEPGARPVLVGGRRLTGWRRTPVGWYEADLSSVPGSPSWVHLLVVDGKVRPRARLPETGVFTHETVFSGKWLSTTGGEWGANKPTLEQTTTMTYRAGDLPPGLSVRNAEVRVYHMWDESLVPVVEHDPGTRTLRFGVPCGHPPGAFDVRKYAVFNVKEGMTRPGNWYHDRERSRIVYRPLPGEDMARAAVFVPVLDRLVRLDGDRDAPVSRVTLRGVALTSANTPAGPAGFGAMNAPAALEVTRATDVVLSGLRIFHVAGYGIRARWCTGLTVEDCDLADLGAGGFAAADSRGVTVGNCLFERLGDLHPSAIAIHLAKGEGARVHHNTVRDASYDGVCNGMTAALFEANRVERVMQELHDGAAFYSGFCRGVTLRGNVVRDVEDTGGYGASAYYVDETGRDHLIEDNLSMDVVCASQNHMAEGNVLRRNLFVSAGQLRLQFPKSAGYRVEDNLLMGAEGVVVQASREALERFSGNLVDPGSGAALRILMNGYSVSGQETLTEEHGNRIAASGIRLRPDLTVEVPGGSRAQKLGIRFSAFKYAGCRRK